MFRKKEEEKKKIDVSKFCSSAKGARRFLLTCLDITKSRTNNLISVFLGGR